MKKILISVLLLSLTACAGMQTYKSTSQNYRPKDDNKIIKLDAALVTKQNLIGHDYAVAFYVNETNRLFFQLDASGNGSLSCVTEIQDEKHLYHCQPFNGHKIGANCNGSTVNGNLIGANCSFTYDDEIAANFRF